MARHKNLSIVFTDHADSECKLALEKLLCYLVESHVIRSLLC